MASSSPSGARSGGEDYKDYYDIMILGKTGMGKTTTADKLLLANPTKANYEYDPNATNSATTCHAVPNGNHLQNGHTSVDADIQAEGAPTSSISTIRSSTKYNDLSMWHLREDQDMEEVTRRLKDLVMWRTLDSPHKHVNNNRKKSESSVSCELLSNDTAKIRVLDVPGFYGPDAARSVKESASGSVIDRAEAALQNDLTIMRKILHIKVATQFKFNRIVYFLPDTGVPTRPSQALQTEISIMERYFKQTVFDCIVVVATLNHSIYNKVREDCDLFPQEELEQTRDVFKQAMQRVFITDDVPDPPIIFISLFDSCDEILRKIQKSRVVREGVGLSFNPSICARCGIHIGKLTSPDNVKDTEAKDEIVICTTSPGSAGSVAVPYDETLCHPMFIPKYHTIQRILGGIAHLVTLKRFMGNWPYFGNEDEVCISCRSPPKSKGCKRVGSKYRYKNRGEGIEVNHTSMVEENYQFVVDTTDNVMRLQYGDGGGDDTGEDDEKVEDVAKS